MNSRRKLKIVKEKELGNFLSIHECIQVYIMNAAEN